MRKYLLLFPIFLITLLMCVIVGAEGVSVNQLDYHSRYVFDMRDSGGKHYMLYIVSPDEKLLKDWGWARQSDKVYRGHYVVFIAKENNKMALLQNIYLFGFNQKDFTEGTFNMNEDVFQNLAYVVRVKDKGQPDILVIAQQVTGSGDANTRTFYIDDGVLYLVYWQNKYGDMQKSINLNGQDPIYAFNNGRYKTYTHIRSMEYTGGVEYVWKLDLSRRAFIFENAKYLNKKK